MAVSLYKSCKNEDWFSNPCANDKLEVRTSKEKLEKLSGVVFQVFYWERNTFKEMC